MIRAFLTILLLFSFDANSSEQCDLTNEYIKARSEVRKIIYGEDNNYRRCLNAASEIEYWRALSKCVEMGDGKNIGGGCAHLVGRGKYIQKPNNIHCEIFKFEPTPELAKNLLDEIVKERDIKKCTN